MNTILEDSKTEAHIKNALDILNEFLQIQSGWNFC